MLLCFLCLITKSFHVRSFPTHMDFFELREVNNINEINILLKPSMHITTNKQNKNFIRRYASFSNVFIEKNGTMHYWTELEWTNASRKFYGKENQEGASTTKAIQQIKRKKRKKRKRKRPRPDGPDIDEAEVYDKLREYEKEREEKQREAALRQAKGRPMTRYQVKLFCPYMGVITTNHYIIDGGENNEKLMNDRTKAPQALTTKVTAKVTAKVTPKVTAKVTAKVTPKVTAKVTAKVTPKVTVKPPPPKPPPAKPPPAKPPPAKPPPAKPPPGKPPPGKPPPAKPPPAKPPPAKPPPAKPPPAKPLPAKPPPAKPPPGKPPPAKPPPAKPPPAKPPPPKPKG